ncbi:hypothetical protein FOZ61_004122, partial [Perkinsus olseni]
YEFIVPRALLDGCIWLMSNTVEHDDVLLFGDSAQRLADSVLNSVVASSSDDGLGISCLAAQLDGGSSAVVNRIEVNIPWRNDARPSCNYKSALSRSKRMIARLARDKGAYDAYVTALKELLAADVVEICRDEDPSSFADYFMCVVPVINASRLSTKCRLCLDARGLNPYIYSSPPGDEIDSMDLWRTLMIWRDNIRVSAEDLSKAFWQVCVSRPDQRFLGLLLPLKDRVIA